MAIQAEINGGASSLDVAPDGSVIIGDYGNYRIRRVGPDGIITTIAGTGINSFSGDGGLAIRAQLAWLHGVGVTPDGKVLIADTYNNRIRQVGLDGIITNFAGPVSVGLVMGLRRRWPRHAGTLELPL
ncbi:MAG: hypothetical protein IPL59_15405 [Candidatus Competibacteraceae bacterium]|nr:hypothetical protein [Candidatus Competibacteraceae bacterium]